MWGVIPGGEGMAQQRGKVPHMERMVPHQGAVPYGVGVPAWGEGLERGCP